MSEAIPHYGNEELAVFRLDQTNLELELKISATAIDFTVVESKYVDEMYAKIDRLHTPPGNF